MQGLNSTEIHVFSVSLWLVPGGSVWVLYPSTCMEAYQDLVLG